MSVTGSRRDAITYGVNGTRSSCEDRGVSWVYWCGWGARATILFVGAGAAQDGIREAALESYAERLLLTSDLPRISGFTMRVCSGAVLRSLMTWSVSVLCPVREGVGLRPLAGRIREGACPVRDGRGWCGARARRRGPTEETDEERGRGTGTRGAEADRICDIGHHQCGAGHPSRLPLFRMVSSKAGAGSAPGAVGGEWRHTNERW